jgi:hypothetical protein
VKSKRQLLKEEASIDLNRPVALPENVRKILRDQWDSFTVTKSRIYHLDAMDDPAVVDQDLWDIYQAPEEQALAYLPKGDKLPPRLQELSDSGFIQLTYRDHYYKRSDKEWDWYRLPPEFWSCTPEELLGESTPPAIRKIVRASVRHRQIELKLTEKATRAAQEAVFKSHLEEATQPKVLMVSPNWYGLGIDLRALWSAGIRKWKAFSAWWIARLRGTSH